MALRRADLLVAVGADLGDRLAAGRAAGCGQPQGPARPERLLRRRRPDRPARDGDGGRPLARRRAPARQPALLHGPRADGERGPRARDTTGQPRPSQPGDLRGQRGARSPARSPNGCHAGATWRRGPRACVFFHKDGNYLAALLGVPVLGFVEPLPGIPPTASHLRGLVDQLKGQRGVILYNSFHPKGGPEFLSRNLGWPSRAAPARGGTRGHVGAVPGSHRTVGHGDREREILASPAGRRRAGRRLPRSRSWARSPSRWPRARSWDLPARTVPASPPSSARSSAPRRCSAEPSSAGRTCGSPSSTSARPGCRRCQSPGREFLAITGAHRHAPPAALAPAARPAARPAEWRPVPVAARLGVPGQSRRLWSCWTSRRTTSIRRRPRRCATSCDLEGEGARRAGREPRSRAPRRGLHARRRGGGVSARHGVRPALPRPVRQRPAAGRPAAGARRLRAAARRVAGLTRRRADGGRRRRRRLAVQRRRHRGRPGGGSVSPRRPRRPSAGAATTSTR